MTEQDPGRSEQYAGDVGSRRRTVGTPTDHESVNVPPIRPGAAENARKAEAARQEHETFIPEAPIEDDRAEATQTWEGEAATVPGQSDDDDDEEDDVRKNIKDTRKELGDTVAALADKADVKARANATVVAAKEKAAEVAGMATHAAKDKAAEVAGMAKHKVSDVTPDQVKDVAGKVTARKRPVLLMAAIGVVVGIVVRRMLRRTRTR
jgi:hypothetical protein